MCTTIHRPEYTHALFTDLEGDDGVLGRFVPLEAVFDVMDQTHKRPAKFVTAEGIERAEIIRPAQSAHWRRVERGCAWVMRVFHETATWRPCSLEAGSSSPFTVVSRTINPEA